jgi:hypothetical protein
MGRHHNVLAFSLLTAGLIVLEEAEKELEAWEDSLK